MPRPVTLFTGQWADLPLGDLAARCGGWGFDGLELACWGDHFDVAQALSDPGYEGPLSIEWEDSGMDRDWGAPDPLAFVRRTDFAPSSVAFDAAFSKSAADGRAAR